MRFKQRHVHGAFLMLQTPAPRLSGNGKQSRQGAQGHVQHKK